MSEAEHPARRAPGREVTVDDIRALVAAATPHFSLQVRNRIAKLIRDLPPDHPARVEGERAIAKLQQIAVTGEVRGEGEESLPPLPSLALDTPAS
jgi:hypothetical protein